MAYVACGRFDGYWQRELNYWDIAAGIIILKEAGGFVDFFEADKTAPLKKNVLVLIYQLKYACFFPVVEFPLLFLILSNRSII